MPHVIITVQIKFARGNDAGAYVISKANIPEYDMFEIGDKILEVRCACSSQRPRPTRSAGPNAPERRWDGNPASGGMAAHAVLLQDARRFRAS